MFSGVISGSGFGITKSGNGIVILSGANSYTGATNVTSGTLATSASEVIADTSAVVVSSGAIFSLGGTETVGSIAGAGSIVLGVNPLITGGDGTSTTFSGTFSGDSGTVTETGSGQLTLSGDNSGWAGNITVTSGTLALGSVNALGNGALALNGGTLTSSDSTAHTIGNGVTIGGNITLGASSTGMLTFGNLVSLGSATRTLVLGSNVEFAGNVSSGGISKSGVGVLEFAGSANTLTGLAITSGGALIDTGAKITLTNGALSTSAGTTLTISGTLLNNSSTALNGQSGSVTVASGGVVIQQGNGSPSAFLFTGTAPVVFQPGSTFIFRDFSSTPSVSGRTYTGNLTFDSSGSPVSVGAVSGGGIWAVNGDLTIGSSVTVNYTAGIALTTNFLGNVTVNGTLGGTGGARAFTIGSGKTLTVASTGALAMATGQALAVTGSAVVSGTISGDTATIVSGTISGTGTVNAMTLGGTVSPGGVTPGATLGKLTAGNTSFLGGSAYKFELQTDGSTGAAGTDWDQLAVNGTLDLSALATTPLTLKLQTLDSTTGLNGSLGSWDGSSNHLWLGIVTSTTLSGFASGEFVVDTSGFANAFPGQFTVVQDGNNLDLAYSSVPEPSAFLSLGLGMVGLVTLRRFRRLA